MNTHLDRMVETIQTLFKSDFSQWPELIDFFSIQELEEGDYWVRAGDLCNEFFFIAKGLVRIYYVDQEGNEINEGFYEEGKFLGPISSFVNGSPCEYNIQAIEPCVLVVANYKKFHDYALDKPEILNFEITFMQSLFVSVAKRDSKRMLSNGEQRYRWFCKEYPHLLDRIPQYHIASFLGMTPVSLSRLRKKSQ